MSGDKAGLSVVVAGGGTAGHIEPALAVADAIRELIPDAVVTRSGPHVARDDIGAAPRVRARTDPPVPLPRKPTLDLLALPARVVESVRRTRDVLGRVDADVVVGFGGYVALPAYLAAGSGMLRRRRRIPVVVHEANASAGIANKIGALRAARVLAAVPGSGIRRKGEADIVGIPVRSSITELDRARCAPRHVATSDFPTTCRCCWCSAALRVHGHSTTQWSVPRPASPRPASLSCTRTDRRTPSTFPPIPVTRRRPMWLCRISNEWTSPIRRRTRWSAAPAR